MGKQKGFTLIEVVVLVIIIACIAVVAIGLIMGAGVTGRSTSSPISVGINGMTETRCIDGYKFIISQDGSSRQFMDENGKGIKCK